MKKKTTAISIIALAALLCAPAASSATPRAKVFFDKQKKEVQSFKKKAASKARAIARAAAETNTIYKPLEETYSFYDEGEWIPVMTALYTYDEQGRVASVVSYEYGYDEEQNRTSYQYDEFGETTQIVEETSDDGGETWTASTKYENAYDPIVTDFRTETLLYSWNDEWELQYGTKYDVTRNKGGVVTGVQRLTNYQDEFTPIARLTNTVGADGKLTACKEEELEVGYGNEFVWEEYFDFRDIVWENTDGQVVGFEPENYLTGANRIKSAKLYYGDEPEADVEGEYADANSGILTFVYEPFGTITFEHAVTDEYGSFYDERSLNLEFEGDELDDEESIHETERYEVTYNERGLVTAETSTYSDLETEFIDKVLYDYTIDPDYDAVRETVVSLYDEEEGDVIPDHKIYVESYTGLSGVASVAVSSDIACRLQRRSLEVNCPATAAVSVFTTDGRLAASTVGNNAFSMSLNGLSSGFYIVKVEGAGSVKTLKIALK